MRSLSALEFAVGPVSMALFPHLPTYNRVPTSVQRRLHGAKLMVHM